MLSKNGIITALRKSIDETNKQLDILLRAIKVCAVTPELLEVERHSAVQVETKLI